VKGLLATILLLCVPAFFTVGCKDEPQAGPTAADYKAERERLLAQRKQQAPAAREIPATADAAEAVEGGFRPETPDYSYQVRGRRDPFQPYRHNKRPRADSRGPLMAYELEQLSVVAVVWNTGNARALVSDPRGDTHVVRKGTSIGKNDGVVIHIGDNMVLVKETYIDFAGELTTNDVELRIRSIQGG